MEAVSLEAYMLRVRVRRTRNELKLGNFFDGNSLMSVIGGYLLPLKAAGQKINILSKSVSIDNLDRDGDFLFGTLRSGVYGFENNIIDTETNQSPTKERRPRLI